MAGRPVLSKDAADLTRGHGSNAPPKRLWEMKDPAEGGRAEVKCKQNKTKKNVSRPCGPRRERDQDGLDLLRIDNC